MIPENDAAVRQLGIIFLSIAVVGAIAMVTVGPTSGQPVPPNSYYGVAGSSENFAPEGTTIVAVANGEVQDSITVGSNGQYGSDEPDGEKLRVSSSVDSEVTFHVNGINGTQAEETDPDPSSEVEELDLTFPVGTFTDGPTRPTETETQTQTQTETETQTQTQTETQTETETETQTQTQTDTGTQTQTESDTQTQTQSESTGGTDGQTETAIETAVQVATAEGDTTQLADLTVTEASLNRTTVPVGGTVLVNATLQNSGNATATGTVTLTVGENDTASANYSVPPGEARQVQFQYEPTETGEFAVSVGQASAGNVTVEGNGGLIPWGLLRTGVLFVVLPVALIYGVLKAIALYYGY